MNAGPRRAATGGSYVTSTIGHRMPAGLVGIHLNMAMFKPTDEERANATPHEQKLLDDAQRYDECYSGYNKVQSTRPQAVGFGLADSPAGLAAWIDSFVQDAAQDARALDLDELIDDIMMYWLPNAGTSAARLYWEVNKAMKDNGAPPAVQPAPAGISAFPGELGNLSRRWAERRFANLVHFNELERGGHFAAWEAPDLFVDELRTAFRSLR